MVVPWSGFPLASLIKLLEPKSTAKYVRFVTVSRPKEMPGMKQARIRGPILKACGWTRR